MVHLESTGQQDQQDQVVQRDHVDYKVFQVPRQVQELPEREEPLDLPDPQVYQEPQPILELLDREDLLDLPDPQVYQDPQPIQVQQVLKGKQDHKEIMDCKVFLVT
jgi:hypothetical protein